MTIRLPGGLDELNWLVGAAFPDADEDALWRLAAAWQAGAEQLRRLGPEAGHLGAEVLAAMDGDSARAFDEYWQGLSGPGQGLVDQLALSCELLAQGCDHIAREVEYAKLQYIIALLVLAATLAWLAATAVLGGVSAAGVPIAIAAAQVTIRALLVRLLTSVVLGSTINVAMDAIAQGIQVLEGHRADWDWAKTGRAATDGALYGLVGGAVFLGAGRLAPGFMSTPGGILTAAGVTGLVGGTGVPLAHGEAPTAEDIFVATVSGAAGSGWGSPGAWPPDAASDGGPGDGAAGTGGAAGVRPQDGSHPSYAAAQPILAEQAAAPGRPVGVEAVIRPAAPDGGALGSLGPLPVGLGVSGPAFPPGPPAPGLPATGQPVPGAASASPAAVVPGAGSPPAGAQPSNATAPSSAPAAGPPASGASAGTTAPPAAGADKPGVGRAPGPLAPDPGGIGAPAGLGSGAIANLGPASIAAALGGPAAPVGSGGPSPVRPADDGTGAAADGAAAPDGEPRAVTDAEALALVRITAHTTDAGLAFYPVGDEMRAFAEAVQPRPGFVTLDLHGTREGFHIDDSRLTPEQFATALRGLVADGLLDLPAGTGIKLVSCDTADGGVDSAAARLARALGVDVIAPDRPVWTAMDGHEIVSSPVAFGGVFVPKYPPDGQWHRFSGAGGEIALTFDPGYPGDVVQALIDGGAGDSAARGGSGRLDQADLVRLDPEVLTGRDPAELVAAVPDDWVRRPSRAGGGEVFIDPHRPGHQLRIMPGYPEGNRPDPLTHGPYAVVSAHGRTWKIPLLGNNQPGGDG